MKIEGIQEGKPGRGWDAYAGFYERIAGKNGEDKSLAAGGTQETPESKSAAPSGECETCRERRYTDGSDDPGVSFKTPTKVAPEQAASAVRGHEMEHVSREQAKAQREDRRVVSQTVTYHSGICPECGDVYVAGGTTRTVTKGTSQEAEERQPEKSSEARGSGGLDTYA